MNLSLPLIFAQPAVTADLTQVYAIIPFLNVLFTYGLETAYFRFSRDLDPQRVYNTLSVSLFISTLFFTVALFLFRDDIASWANLENHPEYITWMAAIIFFDAITTLAFARLRQENRPRRYALATIAGVFVNILVVIFSSASYQNMQQRTRTASGAPFIMKRSASVTISSVTWQAVLSLSCCSGRNWPRSGFTSTPFSGKK